MKLHTVFITYNRLHLTKQAVLSYLETVTVPYTWIVVDNASTDGTQKWVSNTFGPKHLLALPQNRYPGFACNRGWEKAPPEADMLHRADNDFVFLPGWCDEIREALTSKTGQVGLRTDEEDGFALSNVGGNCVIRRELWDKGLRYDERPWGQFAVGCSEDSHLSPAVRDMGWRWTRVRKPCIRNLASGDWSDNYYAESYGVRGIRPHPQDPTVPDDWTGGYS